MTIREAVLAALNRHAGKGDSLDHVVVSYRMTGEFIFADEFVEEILESLAAAGITDDVVADGLAVRRMMDHEHWNVNAETRGDISVDPSGGIFGCGHTFAAAVAAALGDPNE